jgi:hypothetical protein
MHVHDQDDVKSDDAKGGTKPDGKEVISDGEALVLRIVMGAQARRGRWELRSARSFPVPKARARSVTRSQVE